MMAQLKQAKRKKQRAKIDSYCQFASNTTASVVDDYACMLNQTNSGHNNNKYYIIQMINAFGKYYVWNRWGRVGEPGQYAMLGPLDDRSSASKEFRKKFKDKIENSWSARGNFTPVPGKYTLIEIDDGDDYDDDLVWLAYLFNSSILNNTLYLCPSIHLIVCMLFLLCSVCVFACLSVSLPACLSYGTMPSRLKVFYVGLMQLGLEETAAPKKIRPCKLEEPTQRLIKLIFDHDMFKEAMKKMELGISHHFEKYTGVVLVFDVYLFVSDTKKMPLGKISKSQIAKGFAVRCNA